MQRAPEMHEGWKFVFPWNVNQLRTDLPPPNPWVQLGFENSYDQNTDSYKNWLKEYDE